VSYLLDTNACIQLLAGTMNPTLRRLQVEIATTEVFMPTIVLFELWYGVHRSNRPEQNSSRAARLLSMGIEPLEFSSQDAEIAGRIRASLQASNQTIGPYDTLIAGQALARGYTVVTANHREFSRVDGLRWEDWTQA
jgi:tRNA(fMet)-specific endonuclease VapC